MWIYLQFVAFCSTQGRALRALVLFGAQHPEHSEEHTELTPTQHSTSWRARLGKALFGKLLFWILHSTKVILQSRGVFFWIRNHNDIFKLYFSLKVMHISELLNTSSQ